MKTFGERLKQARLAAGFSLRALAERAAPLSATMISKYERSQAMPSSDILIRLAKALGVKVEYFFRSTHVSLSYPQFRRHSRMSKKLRTAVESRITDRLERYLAVEEAFGAERLGTFQLPQAADMPVKSVEEAETVAEALRAEWGLGEDPIDNLCETLEDRGVKVILLEPVDGFDGFSCWANDGIPVVAGVNCGPGDRQRMTLAHELGHLLLNLEDDVDEEKAAYRFAGAFLVPASAVRRDYSFHLSRLSDVVLYSLKWKWGASMRAWVQRLHDLEMIAQPQYVRAQRVFSKQGWNKTEPGEQIPAERPLRFERLVEQGVAEGLFSVSKASEYLGRPFADVRRSMGFGLEAAAL